MSKLGTLSLAARQTWLFALIMVMVMAALGLFVETAIRHHFKVGDNAELEAIIERVEMTLAEGGQASEQRFDDILIGHHHPSLLITDAEQQQVYLSDKQFFRVLSWRPDKEQQQPVTLETSEGHYRLRYQRHQTDNGDIFHITAAIGIEYHLSFLRQFNQSLWLILLVALLMSTLLGWLAIRYSLRPLSAIINEIRSVSATQLKRQLDTSQVPKELAQLCLSLNEMMQRVDEAFQRLSDYSSDIAHELRTPVTSLMTQTQVALSATRTPEEYREVLYSSVEELERMSQMIADMLFLAQTDNTARLPDTETISIDNEIRSLTEFYDLLCEEKNIVLNCQGKATLRANRLMLRRAVGNLLTNAISHTPQGGRIDIQIESDPQQVSIHVSNPGPAIPPAEANKLFDRFYRARDTLDKGHGLGLALVKSIVMAHGGRVTVASDDGINRFSLFIPRQHASAG